MAQATHLPYLLIASKQSSHYGIRHLGHLATNTTSKCPKDFKDSSWSVKLRHERV